MTKFENELQKALANRRARLDYFEAQLKYTWEELNSSGNGLSDEQLADLVKTLLENCVISVISSDSPYLKECTSPDTIEQSFDIGVLAYLFEDRLKSFIKSRNYLCPRLPEIINKLKPYFLQYGISIEFIEGSKQNEFNIYINIEGC